jgi:phosphate transport system substrate-binding protein
MTGLVNTTLTAFAAVMFIASTAAAQLGGTISIDGSSTVFPIAEGVAEEFANEQPKVRVTVGISGTGGGFKRFVRGETDISNASRPIKKEEADQAAANGVEYIEIPIAYDGLSVVVNKSNTFVDQVTVEQLRRIFLEGGAKTWRQVNPAWPDQPIGLFSPGTDSGTFDYMKEVLVKEKTDSFRSDIQVSEDDNVLVTGIAGDPRAIGYFGSAYYFENKEKLRAVAIVNAEGKPVLPAADTIMSGQYSPLSRPLFIYVNRKSLSRPEVKAFVDFFLDEAGGIATEVGYVSLPDELYDRAEANVKAQKTGTQFLTDDGKSKHGPLSDIYR